MAIDIQHIKDNYFAFNLPVPYQLKSDETIYISPVKLINSQVFMASCGILDIDKNSLADAEVISMSYLKFLATMILPNQQAAQQFYNICQLCLGYNKPAFIADERGNPILCNVNDGGDISMRITHKEFDDIKRIIMYQNLPKYDDEYINPELKQAMLEQDAMKSRGYDMPDVERKIYIISAHTGIKPCEQYDMTLREHTLLFEEVRGEVEYSAVKGISCFGGNGDNVQWITPKSKGKFDDYITSVEDYNKSMGGNGEVAIETVPN